MILHLIVLIENHIHSVIFSQARILNQCINFSSKNRQVQLDYNKPLKILLIEELVQDVMKMIRDCKHYALLIERKNFFRQKNQNFQIPKKFQEQDHQIIIQCNKLLLIFLLIRSRPSIHTTRKTFIANAKKLFGIKTMLHN